MTSEGDRSDDSDAESDNGIMARNALLVLGLALLLWLVGSMLLGPGVSGVRLDHTQASHPGVAYQPGELPACVSVHTYDWRTWPGVQTIRSDVWLTGCNNSAGELRASSGPTCQATSFLGRGTATCTASPAGRSVKVVVHIVYPFGLNLIAGQPTTTSWTVNQYGNWSSP